MSKIVKGVKKVWKKTTGKILSKMNDVRKKIMKSKIFKVAVAAAVVYFGGAALIGAMSTGGTAAGGLGSAWAGLKGAADAAIGLNFSGAASALKAGWTGASAAGGFSAASAATSAAIKGASTAATTGGAVGGATAVNAAPSSAQITNTLNTGLLDGIGQTTLSNGTLTTGTTQATGLASQGLMAPGTVSTAANTAVASTAPSATATSSGGLLSNAWNSLGDAGKAAVVTSGVNMAGQMLQGKAEEEAAEEARRRRTYWGMDGDGNMVELPGYGNLSPGLMTASPGSISPGQNFAPQTNWQTTMDELIKRQKAMGV